jgi:hypothetical protein
VRFIAAFCAAEWPHVERERRQLELLAKFLQSGKTQGKNRTPSERICFLSDTYWRFRRRFDGSAAEF